MQPFNLILIIGHTLYLWTLMTEQIKKYLLVLLVTLYFSIYLCITFLLFGHCWSLFVSTLMWTFFWPFRLTHKNNLSFIFPFQLDVVRQNFLSRTKREKIVCTKIDHVAFSDDGGWLATVSLMYNSYHRFRWYATLENKTPAETFPKFLSVWCVIDRSDRNPPITARQYNVEKVRRSH